MAGFDSRHRHDLSGSGSHPMCIGGSCPDDKEAGSWSSKYRRYHNSSGMCSGAVYLFLCVYLKGSSHVNVKWGVEWSLHVTALSYTRHCGRPSILPRQWAPAVNRKAGRRPLMRAPSPICIYIGSHSWVVVLEQWKKISRKPRKLLASNSTADVMFICMLFKDAISIVPFILWFRP
jgi:hypothetical protein